ncbi:MAG: hypothetical protein ABIO85_08355 [Sphingomicrobium sp.]
MGNQAGHWADRTVEICGATALAGGIGASAWLIAPLAGFAPASLAGSAAAIGGLVGWAIVRAAPSADAQRPLPEFHIDPVANVIGAEHSADEALLDESAEQRELPEPSRVIQLFDPSIAETPGATQARIAAHLGDSSQLSASEGKPPTPWHGPPAIPDASDALHAALAEIRRSLRAG